MGHCGTLEKTKALTEADSVAAASTPSVQKSTRQESITELGS